MLKSCTQHKYNIIYNKYLHFFSRTIVLPRQAVRSEAETMVTAAVAARDGVATQMQQATDGQSGLWYFAFGSMCNPTSLSRRGIFPTDSHPAQLQGYKLAFQLGGCACCAVCGPCLMLQCRCKLYSVSVCLLGVQQQCGNGFGPEYAL